MRTTLHRSTTLALAGLASSSRIIAADRVHEIERTARDIASAGQCLHEAQVSCLQDLESITQSGWKQGYERGHAQALGELGGFLRKLEERSRELDQELIGIVMDAVTRIVGQLPPALLTERLIESALTEARADRGNVTLRLHPERAAAAEAWLRRSAHDHPSLRLNLEVDATLGRDDCSVETANGVIEAGIQTQLAALSTVLHER